jgi:NAD+ kinase
MKKIALVVHPTRAAAIKFANNLAAEFLKKDVEVVSNHPDLLVGSKAIDVISDISAVIVLGGDGTILRAAEIVKGHEVPIIGINLGNVGFLAEISEPSIAEIVKAVDSGSIHREPRLTLRYEIFRNGSVMSQGWALNEVQHVCSNFSFK